VGDLNRKDFPIAPATPKTRPSSRDRLKKETRGTVMPVTILTVPEVCKYLRISQVTVYRLLRRRDIPAFRIGKKWRFNLEDLERWIEKESVAMGEPRSQYKSEQPQ
jgi:excisionase family DNA binding protein